MVIGILFVISACFFWGLIFVVPQFMGAYTPVEVALSRYFFYGIFSCGLLTLFGLSDLKKVSSKVWLRALWFGLLANILYYPCLVFSIRYATPVIATLIFGLSPIVIALYGNWKQQECSYKSLVFPAICIILGLGLVNFPALQESSLEGSLVEYCSGVLFGLLAVGLWSYYAVANAQFLKQHEGISSVSWSSIVGAATLAWVLLIMAGYIVYVGFEHVYLRYATEDISAFVTGGLVLGILSTWVGIYCWNKGSSRLPVSFAGQLTVFETIFGLLFVFILDGKAPSAVECGGVALMLSGIVASIHVFNPALNAETI